MHYSNKEWGGIYRITVNLEGFHVGTMHRGGVLEEMNAHTHMILRSKCVNFMYNMVVAIVLKRVDVPSFMIEVLIWNIRRTIQSARSSNR